MALPSSLCYISKTLFLFKSIEVKKKRLTAHPPPDWARDCLLFLTGAGLIHLALSLAKGGGSAHNPIKSRQSVFVSSQQPGLVCQGGGGQPKPWNGNGGSIPAGEIAGMPILSPGAPSLLVQGPFHSSFTFFSKHCCSWGLLRLTLYRIGNVVIHGWWNAAKPVFRVHSWVVGTWFANIRIFHCNDSFDRSLMCRY